MSGRQVSFVSTLLSHKLCDLLAILVLLVLLVFFARENSERGTLRLLPSRVELPRVQNNPAVDGEVEGDDSKKVIIGAVLCRAKNGTEEGNMKGLKYRDQTMVMLKSVLISARLYNISTVEVHLFLEHTLEDGIFVKEQLAGMGYPSKSVNLLLNIHSAVDFVPEQYRGVMIYHPRYRCGFTRLFFPTLLPEVDSIVYLDIDMLITGNIYELWRPLSQFQGEQLIGAAASSEPYDTNYLGVSERLFGDIPHSPPRGINSGLLVMNLTRMREYGWEKRILREYDDYTQIVEAELTDHRAVSILLGHDPGVLKVLSCKLNFMHRHCERGFACEDAAANAGGIQLVHGNGFSMEEGGIFHAIFQAYQKFNMSLIRESNAEDDEDKSNLLQILRTELMLPMRQSYQGEACSNRCCGILDQVLFPGFFK